MLEVKNNLADRENAGDKDNFDMMSEATAGLHS